MSAVYEGFVSNYRRRTRDLFRIATGGSGELPEGELHPDFVNRLTSECVRTAQSVLSMCIRATDYLPPIDPTFSDFLRAMITADFELNRADDTGLRAAMIEAFRQRGIRPESVGSLAVQSLLLESEETTGAQADPTLAELVRKLLLYGARQLDRNYRPEPKTDRKRHTLRNLKKPDEWLIQQNDVLIGPDDVDDATREISEEEEPEAVLRQIAKELATWAKENRALLKLDPRFPVAVRGFHPVHRIAPSGELLVEMVAHFVQTDKSMEIEDLGGLKYRAGVTMIVNFDGYIRYLIKKPFHPERKTGIHAWVGAFDEESDAGWPTDLRPRNRITAAFSARAMDQRRWR